MEPQPILPTYYLQTTRPAMTAGPFMPASTLGSILSMHYLMTTRLTVRAEHCFIQALSQSPMPPFFATDTIPSLFALSWLTSPPFLTPSSFIILHSVSSPPFFLLTFTVLLPFSFF